MSGTFKAILITRDADKKQSVAITELSEADLMEGDVTVSVEYTTVNYKDGLAITGKAPVVRRFPLVPGIDFAGTVIDLLASRFRDRRQGRPQRLGRRRDASRRLCPPRPRQGRLAGAAAGRADAARRHGDRHRRLHRDALRSWRWSATASRPTAARSSSPARPAASARWRSPCCRSSATTSIASTGRPQESDFLKDLGAAEIISRDELSGPAKPLAKERWAGGVDAVGSHTLANVLSMTSYGGAVAACGLAQGMDLPGSVAPFILRGVSLLGIDSVMAPKALRLEAWRRLAAELDHGKLAALSTTIGFDDIIDAAKAIVEGQIRGRVVVGARRTDRDITEKAAGPLKFDRSAEIFPNRSVPMRWA